MEAEAECSSENSALVTATISTDRLNDSRQKERVE
jgi:hypothetical protein